MIMCGLRAYCGMNIVYGVWIWSGWVVGEKRGLKRMEIKVSLWKSFRIF